VPSAIVRLPGADLATCELTHLERQSIDMARATEQHAAYRSALEETGWTLEVLPALPGHPDAVFVEDTAIVLDDVAVLTQPGAESRRGEVPSIGQALAPHRQVLNMDDLPPGSTLDGGDVLRIGDVIYVGQSTRSNHAGLKGLAHLLLPHGYRVKAVQVTGCLHLKTACTHLGGDDLLVNPRWVDLSLFAGMEATEVHPSEPEAGNALAIDNGKLLMPASFPRTAERLEARGWQVQRVDVSEYQKAEGAVTCLSILL